MAGRGAFKPVGTILDPVRVFHTGQRRVSCRINRPDRRLHLTTCTEPFKEMLASREASIDVLPALRQPGVLRLTSDHGKRERDGIPGSENRASTRQGMFPATRRRTPRPEFVPQVWESSAGTRAQRVRTLRREAPCRRARPRREAQGGRQATPESRSRAHLRARTPPPAHRRACGPGSVPQVREATASAGKKPLRLMRRKAP